MIMSEYIEREKVHRLVRSLKRYAWNNPDKSKYRTTVDIDDVQFGIDKIPAADVVEVIRCKDCKYRGSRLSVPTGVYYSCANYNLPYCKPDDYCSLGARMDGETND